MNQRTLLYIVVAVVVILGLGYVLGWFGGTATTTTAPPPATTAPAPATPPASGTGTTNQ
ncbi:MAG: hypothetical protein U1E17_24260 [Geminicoccaceae bacterium]